ncbi:xanthine phosphoribosyltransferase [Laribacter hongkongensis]|uniref:xanthine phosphoribosyltransferase n=1 Tax=Laribacter hongkongensis TaxID=168471 RepID=UPI001EFD10EE|nr:xanthine phosphoribosyltransferase [Laribacter hongkongensis]MCG8991634.1 xanthine phosphoribosyltransferase [Laribacter hongkongensis]MCG8998995.1 xanthine phosphoribosyltransferase [Laribacter hongkongensis]MCG9002494.1 xanthine phosphoribosyltransferase [Laribacter hongkongensis]MCG9004934.1 xanthine phosphoribosyltransferase [Laribacter hongkongensis]MCG9013198.1 xanthine phosphoribosyltransferase [Laribacter hongkongensis]
MFPRPPSIMETLKRKIIDEGRLLDGHILKVDNFLNHQIDVRLMNDIGQAFAERFAGTRIDKILTIEASGIAVAAIASQYFGFVPVVFGKKTQSLNLDAEAFESEVYSYTKQTSYKVRVSKRYLRPGEQVLIIDDFLANGAAASGLIDIVRQAGAEPVGVGIVIEKGFQPGRSKIEAHGIRVESLAIIQSFDDNQVHFG